jgi:hypothetical protein
MLLQFINYDLLRTFFSPKHEVSKCTSGKRDIKAREYDPEYIEEIIAAFCKVRVRRGERRVERENMERFGIHGI